MNNIDGGEVANRCVVRVRTSTWADRRGVHTKKSLLFLYKQCAGFNVLEEEIGSVGAEEAMRNIVNLSKAKDGIYTVELCNISRDYETGYNDYWEYELVPFDGEKFVLELGSSDQFRAVGRMLDLANMQGKTWAAQVLDDTVKRASHYRIIQFAPEAYNARGKRNE